MRARDLAQERWRQRGIATALDASEGAVSRWIAVGRRGGSQALRSHPAPGPNAKLTAGQLRLIPDFLWYGAQPCGFRGDVRTCEPVAGVLGEQFGVSCSNSQASQLLKQIGWTPQIPITRAIQRDEEAIERWRVESWPTFREKVRRGRRALAFVDESGFHRLPSVVKTYAPKGRTPSWTNGRRATISRSWAA